MATRWFPAKNVDFTKRLSTIPAPFFCYSQELNRFFSHLNHVHDTFILILITMIINRKIMMIIMMINLKMMTMILE